MILTPKAARLVAYGLQLVEGEIIQRLTVLEPGGDETADALNDLIFLRAVKSDALKLGHGIQAS